MILNEGGNIIPILLVSILNVFTVFNKIIIYNVLPNFIL